MKKVVVDGMFLRFPINGIPRYAMEVVKAMDMLLSDENLEVILCYPDDIPLEKLPNLKNISPPLFEVKNQEGMEYTARGSVCPKEQSFVFRFNESWMFL